MSIEWDEAQLIGTKFHDTIWYNAIREFRKLKLRKELSSKDAVLDELIRQGLVDKENAKCTPIIQQTLRFAAVLAGRLTSKNYVMEQRVSLASSRFRRLNNTELHNLARFVGGSIRQRDEQWGGAIHKSSTGVAASGEDRGVGQRPNTI